MLLASVNNGKVERIEYSTGDVCMTGEKFRDGVRGAMGDVTDRKCSEEYEACEENDKIECVVVVDERGAIKYRYCYMRHEALLLSDGMHPYHAQETGFQCHHQKQKVGMRNGDRLTVCLKWMGIKGSSVAFHSITRCPISLGKTIV